MKIITGKRRTGKTTKLIQENAACGGYIVCRSKGEARRIATQAKAMGLIIPLPLTYEELLSKQYYGKGVARFWIDNANDLLRHICSPVPLAGITIDVEGEYDGTEG